MGSPPHDVGVFDIGTIIDPTGLVRDVSSSMFFGRIAPDKAYPGQWSNQCFNNVVSSNGQTLTAYWVGSHPAPAGTLTVPNTVHPDAGLSIGTYLGCASVPAVGLLNFFSGGVSIAATAAVIAGMAQHDDVNQCAVAFGNFMTNTYNGVSTADWMSGGTDDMSSMVQGIMQAGPSANLGSTLNYQQSVGPNGPGAAGGGANGPNGGTNDGGYESADGSDSYGYGGAGSLLKASFVDLQNDVVHPMISSAPFSFTLQTNIGG